MGQITLNQLDVKAYSLNNTGCPPIEIIGKKIAGNEIILDCSLSSQFLSSILLIAPYTENGIKIKIANELVSKPYVDMTIDIMEKLGVSVQKNGYENFFVKGSQKYIAGLKLGAMVLGELKTMHFDASFLDKNSLNEVQEWAERNSYQLLIERPDFDAGEIKYEIIEN